LGIPLIARLIVSKKIHTAPGENWCLLEREAEGILF
jgi:hypothetical protein